jgi:hypothetical protein
MSTFQSSQDEQHEWESDPTRVFGPSVERLPVVLAIAGIAIIVGSALLVGGARGVLASLVIEAVVLLVTVPLTLLIVFGIARATGTYFGTLGQAIVRLASFLVASQALLLVVLFSLNHYDLSVAAVVMLACLTILFWVFTALFDLDPVEMLVTFRVLAIFACAVALQSLVLFGLRFLIFSTFAL